MTAEVDQAGLRIEIPRAELDRLGWQPGQRLTVRVAAGQIVVLPELSLRERIESRALGYLMRHVGDATAIGAPIQAGDGWEVPVYLSYEDRRLGVLRFSDEGALIPAKSTTPEEMRAAADAS
jgi:hypothetical protein